MNWSYEQFDLGYIKRKELGCHSYISADEYLQL